MTKTLDLQEEIIEELAFDPRITADDVAVTIKEGIVTLRGTVPSLNEKWAAEDAVKRVRGVRGVADELAVDLPSAHVRTDTDIALAIEHRFATNVAVPATVKFVVKDGCVTLTGEVPWHYNAQEATYEARRVTGVLNVIDRTNVKPKISLSADQVKQKIQAEFARLAQFDAKDVGVSVSGGTVTLIGTVRSWTEHDKAAKAAWSLPGVTRVENFISVTS